MGGGKDQKQANSQLQQQAGYQRQQQSAFDTRNTTDLNASRGRGDELYSSLKGGYEGLLQPGTGLPSSFSGGGSGGGGGGGFALPGLDSRFGAIEDMYKNYMSTGGWDAGTKAAQKERIGLLTDIGKTGGVDEAGQARARGGGVFDEFSRTGGLSDKDQSNIRTRGTSGIPAMYDRVRAEQQRGQAISGGYGPGGAVLANRMARDQSRGAAEAALNAELGIKQQVNQGRQWGAQGMSQSELGLQELLNRNKLSGLTSASDIEGKMMESIMGGQQWGTQGQYGLVSDQQARLDNAAAMNASMGASSAAQSAANEKWAAEFNARQKAAGLEGLNSLYSGPGSGEYNINKQFALDSAGTYGNQIRDLSMAQKTGNRSAWDTAAQFAGAGAGFATGLFGGPTARKKA